MTEIKSNCCNAPLITNCSDEGTCHYVCQKCTKACDIMPEAKDKERSAQIRTILQRLCNLIGTGVTRKINDYGSWGGLGTIEERHINKTSNIISDLLVAERQKVIEEVQALVESETVGIPDPMSGWRDVVNSEELLGELERMKSLQPYTTREKGRMRYGKNHKCPVDGCPGFWTTTNNPNLLQHMRKIASSEVFMQFMLGKGEIKHAQYLKDHMTFETYQVSQFRTDGKVIATLKLGKD